MSATVQAKLVRTGVGRVILHLAALVRDGRFSWHLRGISREFSP